MLKILKPAVSKQQDTSNKTGLYATKESQIGENVILGNPVRLYGKVKVGEKARIGKYTNIGNGSIISKHAIIGDYCSISRDVEIGPANHPTDMLSTHSFQYNHRHFPAEVYQKHARVKSTISQGKAIIGNDVWIGAKAMIMRGVTVGHGAVVAGGAIVTKDVPPYAIVAGVPAKVIRKRFDEETISKLLNLNWWVLRPEQMDGVNFADINEAICQISEIKENMADGNNIIGKSLTNNGGGSKKGIIWVSPPSLLIDESIFPIGASLEVTRATDSQFGGMKSELLKGKYTIRKAKYDSVREKYRIEIEDESGNPFIGVIGNGAVDFTLLV